MATRKAEAPTHAWRPWFGDAIAVLVLVVAFFAVNDFGPALRQPYWLDEAWVALSTRLPIHDLPTATATTPIGWSALLRAIPSPDRLRLLPVGFLGGSVLLAYALARTLPWPRPRVDGVLAGLAAALMVLLLPAQQVRYELKQYTADAAIGLLVLLLTARVETSWSRRRLAALAAATVLGMLVSYTTAIVGAVAFTALLAVAVAHRRRRAAIDTAAAGAVAGLGLGVVYLLAVRPNRTTALDAYWKPFFPEPADLGHYARARLDELQVYLGMSWPLLIGLMLLGIVTIAVSGRPATAIAAAGVPLAMVVLGVGQIYPLLDLRTSHVLFVLANALAGIGIAGVASWLGRWLGRRSATLGAVGSGAMILVAVTAYADANRDWLRLGSRAGPGAIRTAYGLEDVRTAVDYVRRHRRPGDVVLVGPLGAYAFAYYWPADVPTLADRPGFALRWGPTYPAGSGIVVVPSLTAESIRTGTATAVRLARERGPATRIWLIRSHAPPSELAEWTTALQGMRTETTPSGREPAVLVEPAANP